MGRFKDLGLEKRERFERDRFYFEDAEDYGRDTQVMAGDRVEFGRDVVLTNIRALMRRAEDARVAELSATISGERAHPDAPHPDTRWRARSRYVFRRMVSELYLHVAPWHHHEVWVWAASCAAGAEWIEREVCYWEKRLVREEARRRAIRDERLQLPPGEPVDDDDAL